MTNQASSMRSLPTHNNARRGFVRVPLDLLSSVWFGVFLLTLLFVYCSVGSALPPVRQLRIFEMTEYEWFNYWPFDLLIALLCLNIIVSTFRRIPLNAVTLGTWLTHIGILILCAGSVWYFGTKVEGDAPIARRQVVINIPNHDPVIMIASPGNSTSIDLNDETYTFQVSEIIPDWEILSGDDQGKRTYKVSVLVQSPTQLFMRELLDGYPQYTEDLIRSDDSEQPFERAKKTLDKPLVDEELTLTLEYAPQRDFYLVNSAALYLREVGQQEWTQRPIESMPRYNDYVSQADRVWSMPGHNTIELDPLEIEVPPAGADDPLPETTIHVTDYLRYVMMQSSRAEGGDQLDPWVKLRLRDTAGRQQDVDMLAFSQEMLSVGGTPLEFHWVEDEDQFASLTQIVPPTLHVSVIDQDLEIDHVLDDLHPPGPDSPFIDVEGTDYRFRIVNVDRLVISEQMVSWVAVEIEHGEKTFQRWIFDDPALTRDVSNDGAMTHEARGQFEDANIQMTFDPGRGAGIHLVAGPEDTSLRILLPDVETGATQEHKVNLEQEFDIGNDISLSVLRYAARSTSQSRPMIVPKEQQRRDVGMNAAVMRISLPTANGNKAVWLPFHTYAFSGQEAGLYRFPYSPQIFTLPDGREIEIIFSRQRRNLPVPAALDTFRVKSHVGGFSGDAASILDWLSYVAFADGDSWDTPRAVSTNAPIEHEGLWYFQSQWDPPDPPRFPGDASSNGLNYTVLGIANRNGVLVQLLGCTIAVIGMIYAFYIKPIIKRQRMTAQENGEGIAKS